MADFIRICRDDGLFLVDEIPFDRENTIKVYGENGTLMGLPFFIPGEGMCISEYWRRGKAQMGHFHIVFL